MDAKYDRLKTVLITENNTAIREALKHYLETVALLAVEATNGNQAVEVLQKMSIDLLITDFRMQGMDGVELLKWCRANSIHIPVIFLSAHADLVKREQIALEDCCATLMFKPINFEVFTAALGAADSRSHHKDCIHFRDTAVR